ncbi:hypothetical protein B5F07_05825 [Lachnoclostridium sp. An169]|uniref:DUF6106 family protein n=1 Tax=Lachnoclostridium sp. An169 TaxID=1965569 RepID=UPI000B37D776|nr:DUF6106 family protein [Lachnoclostridium sp. An169]OUP85190.1 hypothetical protein B5F07_05825 [Lachnoclostridium sp. An169]HJA67455.1 hypothetical protein [Candidatus Mediterraneibacter cottocaccae]
MNDALYEQLVARRPKPYDIPVRILIILLIVAVVILGTPFIGFFAFVIAIILGLLAYYLIFPKLSIEYEYILLNHDMQIDVIYSKEKRKHKLSFDIQNAEIIAPKSSHRLDSYKPEKVYDFTSEDPSAKAYGIMISLEQKNVCIYFEPDEKMLDHMKQWMGMKLYLD